LKNFISYDIIRKPMPREFGIQEFSQLPPEDQARLAAGANWQVKFADGTQRGDWTELEDTGYGVSIKHVAVLRNGGPRFDKFDITYLRGGGVFVLPMHVPASGIAEFGLVRERRILLQDENGQQGDVFVENIPQGGISPGETLLEAARRETREETGMDPVDLVLTGRTGFDIPNSRELAPIFLALVDPGTVQAQKLDEHEDIGKTNWYTWRQLQDKSLIDSKTIISLHFVQQILRPELLQLVQMERAQSSGLYIPRTELDNQQSLERFIIRDKYPQIRKQTASL
jgi:ADP-ribose pyrophosphatase YjhB (NUDIX family)